jgi:hypothetical protein
MTRDVRIADSLDQLPIGFGDGAEIDAFQRLRVGNPAAVFENKNIHDRSRSQWEEPIVGAIIVHGAVTGGPFQVGETITGGTSGTIGTVTIVGVGSLTYGVNHNDFTDGETITGGTSGATTTVTSSNTGSDAFHTRDTASVTLQAGDTAGDAATRQTHRYFSYVPGKSHEIWMTFNFSTAGDVGFVLRSKTSGSAVDKFIHQNDPSKSTDGTSVWNLDKMDGTGQSRIKLDFTKEMFLVIDMQWQGTGRVRMGFFHNGRIIYAHAFNFSNTLEDVYMSTPSLPVKHEIENIDGATIERRSGYFNGDNGLFLKQSSTDASRIMKEVCTAIVSIGGQNPVGLGFSVSNEVTGRTLNDTTEVPLLAIRLKNVHPKGGPNRVTVALSSSSFFPIGNSSHFHVEHLHDPSGITATWNDVGPGSACEYSVDITTAIGSPSHKVVEGYIGTGQAGKGANENIQPADKLDQHRFLSQNYDSSNSEIFVIWGITLTGAADGYSHLSWIEFD